MMLRRHILPAAKRLGIQKRIGGHTFRRTAASLLMVSGASVKVSPERLNWLWILLAWSMQEVRRGLYKASAKGNGSSLTGHLHWNNSNLEWSGAGKRVGITDTSLLGAAYHDVLLRIGGNFVLRAWLEISARIFQQLHLAL
jgi:hypothetical protein